VDFITKFSAAFVTNSSGSKWLVIYRPSYTFGIDNDLLIKSISSSDNESDIRTKLSSDNPILAVANSATGWNWNTIDEIINLPYLSKTVLSNQTKSDPDNHILPLDIVKRPIGESDYFHFAVYLGDKKVVHITGSDDGTKIDSWYNFCNPSGSSSYSSSSGSGNGIVTRYHPIIPFKQFEKVYSHIALAVGSSYGKTKNTSRFDKFSLPDTGKYHAWLHNCEAVANELVLGINLSRQAGGGSRQFRLEGLIEQTTRNLEALDSSYYRDSFTEAVSCMGNSQKNRSYSRSQDLIKQETFEGYIEINPNSSCRIQ